MRRFYILLLIGGLAFPRVASAVDDPYEVLRKYADALGGIEALRAETTAVINGGIELEGTGLSGPFKQWAAQPIRSREEVDLGVIKQTSGDNGQYRWVVDQNGKLQQLRDSVTVRDRRVQMHMADFDFLDPESDVFIAALTGVDTVDEHPCYVIRLTNSINDDTVSYFIDTVSFLRRRTISKTPSSETQTLHSDYREVNGVLHPFHERALQLPTRMTQIVNIDSMATNVAVDPAMFEPPEEDVRDFTIVDSDKAAHVPFQLIENHIYLRVSINGDSRLWVLDSGAGASVIMTEYAEELGLEPEGNLKGQGAGNLVDFSFAVLPAYSVPGVKFASQKIVVADFSWLFDRTMGLEVVGILGYDFLSRLVTRIDYANEELGFYDPGAFEYHGDGVEIDAPLTASNMFHVPATVDGEYDGLWNLDLGASGCSFHFPFAEAHGLLDRRGYTRVGFGAGGEVRSRQMRFRTVEFGGFTIERPVISVTTERGEGGFSSGDLTGNLGNTLLRHFTLYLDYKRGRVIVEPGDDFETEFPEDHSGAQFLFTDDGRIEVFHVAEGTPADQAGLIKGDILLAIDDQPVEELDGLLEIREILKQPPGTRLGLTVERDGESRDVQLTLVDLFD